MILISLLFLLSNNFLFGQNEEETDSTQFEADSLLTMPSGGSLKTSEIDSTLDEAEEYEEDSQDSIITETEEIMQDSLVTNDDEVTNWNLGSRLIYQNKQLKAGADLSNGKPIMDFSVGIMHDIGLSMDFDATQILGKNGSLQDWSLGAEYALSLTDWMDFNLGLYHYFYKNDTINILSASNNSINLSADFMFNKLIFDVSYEHYFGTDKINNLSLTGLYILKIGNFKFVPLGGLTYSSYTVDKKRTNQKNSTKNKNVTQNGISSIFISIPIYYYVVGGFSIYASPSYNLTPLGTISLNKYQFIIKIGIDYSLDF